MTGFTAFQQLEEQFKKPFARWSPAAWNSLVTLVLPTVLPELKKQLSDTESSAVIEGYLKLVAQGIGRGHLFPHGENIFPNFFIFSWEKLVPRWLIQSSTVTEKLEVMARLWNLSESLKEQPAWIEHLLIAGLNSSSRMDDIAVELQNINSLVMEAKTPTLTPQDKIENFRYVSIDFPTSPFFLPHQIIVEAPGLLAVSGLKFDNEKLIEENFYVLLRPTPKVFTQNLKLPSSNPIARVDAFSDLAGKMSETIPLELESYAVGDRFVSIVFKGSQRIHLWELK